VGDGYIKEEDVILILIPEMIRLCEQRGVCGVALCSTVVEDELKIRLLCYTTRSGNATPTRILESMPREATYF
jgi:hypothetical protein